MVNFEKLEVVKGSQQCQFSIVENKLAAIYRNQRRIYFMLGTIAEFLGINFDLVDPTRLESEKLWQEKE